MRDGAIAVVLIDAIDDDGYPLESAETLRDAPAPDRVVDVEEIEAVRRRLLRYDPVGVGARSLGNASTSSSASSTPARRDSRWRAR